MEMDWDPLTAEVQGSQPHHIRTPNQQQNHHNDNANAQSLPCHSNTHMTQCTTWITTTSYKSSYLEHHNSPMRRHLYMHEKDDIKLFTHRLRLRKRLGYTCPWTHYTPPHVWYNPPYTPTCLDAPCSILACTPRLHNVCH